MSATERTGNGEKHAGPDPTPEGRAAMKALVATGRYEEMEDSFEWLWREAADVAEIVREHADEPIRAEAKVHFLLTDTALYDLTLSIDRNRIDDDVRAIVAAVRAATLGRQADDG